MNIEKIKAAMDAINDEHELVATDRNETFFNVLLSNFDIETIRTLLDQAINAPDLESLKRESEPDDSDYILGTNDGWNAAIDHLAPRIVREGWQPIETAPKDDKVMVLLYWPHWCSRRAIIGYWANGYGWCADEALSDQGIDPTHWMPLPQPPASKGD